VARGSPSGRRPFREGSHRPHVADENDIIAFGIFESDPRETFFDPKLQELQEKRVAGMAPHIDAIGPDSL
jgi:hypothetical protein